MRIVLFLSCLVLMFAQNLATIKSQQVDFNRLTNAQKMEFKTGGTFHFRGIDPDLAIKPEFSISSKNLIDTLNLNYITVLNAQVYLNQLKEKISFGKAKYDFAFKFEVFDEKDKLVFEETVQKNLKLDAKSYKDQLYYLHQEELRTTLKNGSYRYKVTIKDMKSEAKIENSVEIPLLVKAYYKDKLLISDIRLFDSTTRKEIKSANNNFTSNVGDVILYFDTYKKGTKYQFVYDLEIRKLKKSSEVIKEYIGDFVNKTGTFIKSLFTDSIQEDTLFRYYDTILYDDDKRYNRFQLRIPKSEFKNFNFYEPNYGQRFLEITIKPKIQILSVSKAKNNEENLLNINKMTDSNFVDMTITSDIDEVMIIDSKDIYSTKMTFGWEKLPNTKTEYYQTFTYLSLFMEESEVAKIKSLSLYDLEKSYKKILKELSQSDHPLEILSYYNLLLKKIQYANYNFFYVYDNGSGTYSFDARLKNGWSSDKGRLYLKYGLPDEVSGTNYIAKDGKVIETNLLAKQRWYYKKINKEYFFVHNKIIN